MLRRRKRKEGDQTLTDVERNVVIRIAKGELKEENLQKPLTEEQKKELEFEKEIVAIHKKNGYDELNRAMSTDE